MLKSHIEKNIIEDEKFMSIFFSFSPKVYVYKKIIEIILQFAFEESVYICKD